MPDLLDMQKEFGRSIWSQTNMPPEGMFEESGPRVQIGWQIYQNNVFHSLLDAMADTFPVVQHLVGEDFFRFAAREYVKSKPPKCPILAEFGSEFASFLETFSPAKGHGYLGDVARLEYAWLLAYHAGDADPIDPTKMQGLAAEEAMNLRLELHPSTQFVSSAYPVFSIWTAHQSSGEPDSISLDEGAEHVAIVRDGLEVNIRLVDSGELAFWVAVQHERTLGDALETAVLEQSNFDLGQVVARGLSSNLICGSRF